MAGFDEAAVVTFVDNIISHASKTAYFSDSVFHEPKAPPGRGLRFGAWVQRIEPLAGASGLASSSGYVVALGRIYGNMLQKPEDEIDPRIMRATTSLMRAYIGDFNFGATARNVDILGAYGEKLMAQAGYVTVDSGMYRVMTITIPVVFNDMWDFTP